MFQFEDRQNVLHQHGVVYEITWSCGSSCIGQTCRNLITRLNNHNPATTIAQDTDVARRMIDNPNHQIDFRSPSVLAHSNHWRKLLIRETLLIQQRDHL